jgi:hypothetical protein
MQPGVPPLYVPVTRLAQRIVALAIALGALSPSMAAAQRQRDPAIAEARELYAQGLELVEDGRWADAMEAFRRSYELSAAPPALFNLALALRALGRVREARDRLAELGRLEGIEPTIGDVANVLRLEAASRVAILTIEGLPSVDGLELRLDGASIDDGARPLRLELDPGEHALSVSAPGYAAFEWQRDVDDGEEIDVDVELRVVEPEIWPWIVVGGAGAALVVVAVAIGVAVGTSQTDVSWPQVPRLAIRP